MKKISIIFSFFVMAFISCEKDESLDPRPDLIAGEYVRLDVKDNDKLIDFNNIATSSFKGVLTSPGGKIVRYEMFVRRLDFAGVRTGDFVPFKTITSFPYNLEVSAQDIATVFGLNVSDLKRSEVYQFVCYSYDEQGNKFGYLNLSRTVQTTTSMKQGYRFSTKLEILSDINIKAFNIYAPFGV